RLLRDLDAHGGGRTFHHAHRRLDGIAVEVLHLLLGDLAHLRLGHGAGLLATRRLRSALELGRLLDEIGYRRRAHLEGERAVLIDRDHDRDRRSLLHLLGLRVELLAELHDGEAALTERGPDRGRRIGRPRRHLQFDVSGDFLCHDDLTPVVGRDRPLHGSWSGFRRLAAAVTSHDRTRERMANRTAIPHPLLTYSLLPTQNFSPCPISSSTRVGRPKTETATLSRARPSSISSTTPLKEANGPSHTRTCSPTSKESDGLTISPPAPSRGPPASGAPSWSPRPWAASAHHPLPRPGRWRRRAAPRGRAPLAPLEGDRRLRPFDALLHLMHDARRLGVRNRLGLVVGAEKARDLRRVLDEVVGFVGEVHLHQHVAGEEFALGVDLLSAAHLHDLFGRHHDLFEQVIKVALLRLLADRIGDLALDIRIGLDDVPVLVGHSAGSFNRRCRERGL